MKAPIRAARSSGLRARLRQAEETLRAIRAGEVDAFIVSKGRGPQVAVLEGADHPYVALIERINEGAMTLSADGAILYCNGFLATFLGRPRTGVLGMRFRNMVVPDDRAAFDVLLAEGIAQSSHGVVTLRAADGTHRPALVSLSSLARVVGKGRSAANRVGVIGIVTDLDEQQTGARRLESRVRQQAAIAELGQRALSGIPVDAVLEDATHLVMRTLGASHCAVSELLPGGSELRIRALAGEAAIRLNEVLPAREGVLSQLAIEAGAPVVVHDVAADPRFRDRPGSYDPGVVSAIAVVVADDDGPFGVLGAGSALPHRFTEDDTHFLQAVANVLATAIGRKRGEDLRRWLLAELTRSRDDERRRLARELHDETRQSLWAIVVGLDALESTVGANGGSGAVQRLRSIADRALVDMGRLARGLHPGALDDHGLVAATSQYLDDFTASYGIPVEQGVEDLAEQRLPPEVEMALYRILQEALTNVARHAQASAVRVSLRRVATAVELTITDDGIGFQTQPLRSPQRPGGLGLHSMRERVAMLGGKLTVASRPVRGTTVTARIPLVAQAAS